MKIGEKVTLQSKESQLELASEYKKK